MALNKQLMGCVMFTTEQVCNIFRIPTYLRLLEEVEFFSDAGTEEERDSEAECFYDLLARAYENGFEKCCNTFSERFNMRFVSLGDDRWNLESNDWSLALNDVVDTINGVGYFHFNDGNELIDSGPYEDAKEAVIKHVHWTSDYSDVYGVDSLTSIFNRSLERAGL